MIKEIEIDGKKVKFKATAAIPRLYRLLFRRDIIVDMKKLQQESEKIKNKKKDEFEFKDLELFENVAYTFAKHADPQGVPNSIDEWLDQFETFSIYFVLPEILELWGLNIETQSDAKKKHVRQLAK